MLGIGCLLVSGHCSCGILGGGGTARKGRLKPSVGLEGPRGAGEGEKGEKHEAGEATLGC